MSPDLVREVVHEVARAVFFQEIMFRLRPTILFLALFTILGSLGEALANWPYWASDAASTRYVPFDQIHRGNVYSLRISGAIA